MGDFMEFFGFAAFLLIVSYMSYPSKIKKLEKQLLAIKRSEKGGNAMSKLISELKGHRCQIKCEEGFFALTDATVECEVIDSDDEWIKISFKDKKGIEKMKIIRIENIQEIELIF